MKQQNTYLTEIKETPQYNVDEDDYFNYEKQYKEMMKNKEKKNKIEYSSEGNRMPCISMRLLDEAINQNILPLEKRERLIRNPNKYSIFFCKFNSDSPNMRKAMQDKGISQEGLNLLSFDKFSENCNMSESTLQKTINSSVNQDYLKRLIMYLSYVTDHYEKLKDLMNYRQMIKRRQKSEIMQSQTNNSVDSIQRYNYTQTDQLNQNASFGGRFNQSFIDLNKSVEKSIISYDDRVRQQKQRALKEQRALGKFVEQFIEKKQQREQEYNQSLEGLEKRIQKNEQVYKIQLIKKQQQQKVKQDKVIERMQIIQEKKEEKIMNKFKRMDFAQERANQKKIELEKEREEFLKNNNNLDAKLLKIKEKQYIKEERLEDERQQLEKQIEEKQMKSAQLMQSVQNLNKMRIQEQKNKYNRTMDNIMHQEKISSANIIQSLVQSHLDIQQKIENKMKNVKKFFDERQKEEKKKMQLRERVRTRLESQNEKLQVKLTEKMDKHQEKIDLHKLLMAEKQHQMHEKLEVQIRKVQMNKSQQDLYNYEKSQKIIDKNEWLSQQQARKKLDLELFKESSRSLSLQQATKKQDILSKLV